MGFLLLGALPPFAHSLIIITHSPRTHSLHHRSLSLTHSSSSLTHHRKTVHATKRSVGGPPPASRARGGSLATTLRKTVNATINTLSEALDRHRPPWAKDCIIATQRFLGGPRPAPRARARARAWGARFALAGAAHVPFVLAGAALGGPRPAPPQISNPPT